MPKTKREIVVPGMAIAVFAVHATLPTVIFTYRLQIHVITANTLYTYSHVSLHTRTSYQGYGTPELHYVKQEREIHATGHFPINSPPVKSVTEWENMACRTNRLERRFRSRSITIKCNLNVQLNRFEPTFFHKK